MTNTDWIKDLKVGDKIAFKRKKFGRSYVSITTVKKITPKGYIRTNNDILFRDGNCKIDSWDSWTLMQWTPELEDILKAKAKTKLQIQFIKEAKLTKLTPDQIQRVYNIIKEQPTKS